MLKRLLLNLSVAVFVAGLALPVHSAEVRKLNRMRSMWATWMWNTTRPGNYVVEFFADTRDDVQEHNENNNSIKFVITVGPWAARGLTAPRAEMRCCRPREKARQPFWLLRFSPRTAPCLSARCLFIRDLLSATEFLQ